jgi:lysophospholipase L1-like esterase
MVRRGLCIRSLIYNKQHIKEAGLNCPYKHTVYHWPAKQRSEHCIIGDSIIKFIKVTNLADVISEPGINIDRLAYKLRLRKWDISSYSVIVVHVGTNDVECNTPSEIIKKFQSLLEIIKQQNKQAKIAVSSILPKPCKPKCTNDKICIVNSDLKRLCTASKSHFIPSYRPFAKKLKQGSLDLFAIDRLHLSFKGAKCLRDNLVGNIKSIQGQ